MIGFHSLWQPVVQGTHDPFVFLLISDSSRFPHYRLSFDLRHLRLLSMLALPPPSAPFAF
jgi:hypothetical protein